jgi:hypothetical protein
MGTKRQPGAFDAWEKAEEDEPMFVLLARDPLAPAVIEAWATLREAEIEAQMAANLMSKADENREWSKVDEARACARLMRRWFNHRDRLRQIDSRENDGG